MHLDILKKITQPVFYVTNDVARGIGLETLLPNFHIVCLDDHPLIDILSENNVSVFCLERELGKKNALFRSSALLLESPLVISFIKEKAKGFTPNILFFKPQKKLELIAGKYGFKLIGNSTELAKKFENKINFFDICRQNNLLIPESKIFNLGEIDFLLESKEFGLPFVIQFGFGWAGNSTFFIDSETKLREVKKNHGNIKVKVSKFINGITVLNNAVVMENGILQSPPALQIKSNSLLSANPGGTGGRQWPVKITEGQSEKISHITKETGLLMGKEGYRGFFGLDFLIDQENGEVYLSENNARITASCPFYTKLELENGSLPLLGYHLLSFMGMSEIKKSPETQPVKGSEIVAKNTTGSPIEILNQLKVGMYNQDLDFIKESSFLEKSSGSDFWLTCVAKGRLVNPEIEVARINTYAEVCDNEGNLKEEYTKTIQKIYRLLGFNNAQK